MRTPKDRRANRWCCALAAGAVLATLGLPTVAGARTVPPPFGGRVKPGQVFSATVNGQSGVGGPVTIAMACFGPVHPGETGHPMAGQTVAVLGPNVVIGTPGNTGAHGTEIGAFFGPPPPAAARTAAPVTSSGGPVSFRRYVHQAIPTAEVLACSGTGRVTFVALPMSPGTSSDVVVPVSYVGQP